MFCAISFCACHASANPLTAHYGLVHGLAVQEALVVVVAWADVTGLRGDRKLAKLSR